MTEVAWTVRGAKLITVEAWREGSGVVRVYDSDDKLILTVEGETDQPIGVRADNSYGRGTHGLNEVVRALGVLDHIATGRPVAAQ